jgi:hypothetical protein
MLFAFIFTTQCKDGSFCPGTQTCCLTPHGVGCCPYTNAVCCGDGIHCCPNSYRCVTGGCQRSAGFLEFLEAVAKEEPVQPAEKLQSAIKSHVADMTFEVLKCLEDVRPFAKELKDAYYHMKDIEGILKMKDLVMDIYNHSGAMKKDCYDKVKQLVHSYFNN